MKYWISVLFYWCIVTCVRADYPKWMEEVNAPPALAITQGRGAFLVVADLAPVSNAQEVFQDRIFYFQLPNSLVVRPANWQTTTRLTPSSFISHATSVAFLAGGSCSKFKFNQNQFPNKEHVACGIAQEAKLISLDNAVVASIDKNPGGMASTVLRSLGININSIPTYDRDGTQISVLPNLMTTTIVNMSIGQVNEGIMSYLSYLLGISPFIHAKKISWRESFKDNLLVVAAGNEGKELTEDAYFRTLFFGTKNINDMFPQLLINVKEIRDNIIVVGAISDNGKYELSETSNYGKFVEIAAPGKQLPAATDIEKFDLVGGTTYAASIVSGAGELLLSCNNKLTGQELKRILLETADTKTSLDNKVQGNKFLNIGKAVDSVCKSVPSPNSKKPIREKEKNPKREINMGRPHKEL